MIQTDRCPACNRPYQQSCGRPLRITDEQIVDVLSHYRAEQPKHTIRRFCEQIGISPYTYRIVAYKRLKRHQDIERVTRIETQIR